MSPRFLFVVPHLEYGGLTSRAALLATGLARSGSATAVVSVGPTGPAAGPLRAAGVAVECLGRRRAWDVRPLVRFRELARAWRPDAIHAWGGASLRVAALIPPSAPCRVVASDLLQRGRGGPSLPWIDRRLLPRVGRVVAWHAGEAQAYGRMGVTNGQLSEIPPAVLGGEMPPEAPFPLPPGKRYLACVGPLRRDKGHRDALWSYDILRYLFDDLDLVVVGEGPERERLAWFARRVAAQDRVHLLGAVPDVAAVLARAVAVWVPSLYGGGVQAALEAMALGKPVVAARVPGLSELLEDGVTGHLVPPGDKIAVCRVTRRLLEDAARCRRMGQSARQQAAERFSAGRQLGHYWEAVREGVVSA